MERRLPVARGFFLLKSSDDGRLIEQGPECLAHLGAEQATFAVLHSEVGERASPGDCRAAKRQIDQHVEQVLWEGAELGVLG